MQPYPTERIRNVALVGHGGAGKTSLAEALLHRSGVTTRLGRVDNGTSICDYDPEERARGISLSLAIAPVEWHGHKINLIDTPGYADFVGDVAAALRIADLVVFVVSAVDGVQVQTRQIWRMADRMALPRMIFINKLDRERADFDRTLAQLSEAFGTGIAPLALPLGREVDFHGVADLLTDQAHIYHEGVPRTEAIPEELAEWEEAVRESLVEGILMANDTLLERYLEGEEPSLAELERTLHDGVVSGEVFPVAVGSATSEIGVDRMADYLVEIGPSPLDRAVTVEGAGQQVQVSADPNGDPLAFVFKTIADPYVGQLSIFRVLSGTIHVDDHLVNSRSSADERLHGLVTLHGKDQSPTQELQAGDIGAVAKLNGTQTGDTLAPKGTPVAAPPIDLPAPTLAVAVEPETQADDDKLVPSLRRIQDEDPTLTVERNDETHQTLLWGAGDTHLQITLDKLARKFGTHVRAEDPKVAYRETITAPVEKVEGKHKKQTGGHGQFGVCVINLEPLSRGRGFEFENRIVGGAISRSYIPAVEKGIEEAMREGGHYGHSVVDVKATLIDGKEHTVDSSEMAFKVAGRLAFRAALARAKPVILEPIGRLEVTVPNELQGDVMGDLNARRGRMQGTELGDEGETTIVALVPRSEMQRYTIDLRSLTGGRGEFRFVHDHYDVLPAQLTDRVRKDTLIPDA